MQALEISRGGVRLIKQNYAIVAGLNTLALGLALPGGLITPADDRGDQQRLRDPCELERDPSDPSLPMMASEVAIQLSPQHQKALRRAVGLLENPDFAGRLAEYAGQPIDRALRLMPKAASDRLNESSRPPFSTASTSRSTRCKTTSRRPPASRASSLLAGISGGVSGFFGMAALPLELPVTTTLMLRAIADIARHHGEDLSDARGAARLRRGAWAWREPRQAIGSMSAITPRARC